jgi:hypothetical protein
MELSAGFQQKSTRVLAMMRLWSGLAAVAVGLGVLVGGYGAASGANFLVTNLNDAGPGSLRQAVADANASMGADVIAFPSGLSGTIHLTSGEILIADSVSILGPGARQLAVDSTARIFLIRDPSSVIDVLISGLTLTGANASGNGGAIANDQENLTLRFMTLSGNHASGEGGAIANNLGMVRIENSTLSGNSANKAGAIYSVGFQLVIVNSTVSGNTANDSVGGIKLEFAFASIFNSTVSGNSASFSQGGILLNFTQLDLDSTIVANNTDIAGASDLVRFNGTVNAANSLFEQNLAAGVINGTNSNNQTGVDPLLGPLADNGGPIDTHAITAASPALNRGSNPLALTTDQRGPGYPRVYGGGTDVGAFELGPPNITAPTLSFSGLAALVAIAMLIGIWGLRRTVRVQRGIY